MPGFQIPFSVKKFFIAVIVLLASFFLDVRLVLAADYEPVGRNSAAVTGDYGSPDVSFHTRFQAGNFRNQSLGVSGVTYSAGLGLAQAGAFEFYGEVPFLWGDNRGAPIQEIGNPKLGFDFSAGDLGGIDFWLRAWTTITQPSGKLASRHDTYRAGGEFRIKQHRFFSHMGAGHRFRVNENDKTVDVGDMSDFDLLVGYSWRHNWSLLGTLEWFHTDGVKARGMTYARDAAWAGISPGIRYRGGGGLEITTSVTFPILQSRDEPEMEVAFWDMSVPPISQASLRTQVGVWF